MEESECIVCFSQYNEDEHRARCMPCGHTMCSKCLKKTIREVSKMCPKCRQHFTAARLEELPVNFSLEGMIKSSKSLKTQLELAKPCISIFEESCKKAEECKKQSQKIFKEYEEAIIRKENIIAKLQEEIKTQKNARRKMEEKVVVLDEKLSGLKEKRNSYEQAITPLNISESIREVFRWSVEVQNEAEKLISVSQGIENEIDQMMRTIRVKDDHLMENSALSISNEQAGLHVYQDKHTYNSSPAKLKMGNLDKKNQEV
ncbi:unnamed protein product, partial [Meganyctiphanes norvegica]